MINIEQRPELVNTRSRIGDWEGDTVIGKDHKSAIYTLVDRKSLLLSSMARMPLSWSIRPLKC